MSLPSQSDEALAAEGEARSGDTPVAPIQPLIPEAAATPSSEDTNSADMARNLAPAPNNPSTTSAATSTTTPPASTTLATGLTGTSTVNANSRPLPIACAETGRSPAHSDLAGCFSAATAAAENIDSASSVADGGPSGQKADDGVQQKSGNGNKTPADSSTQDPATSASNVSEEEASRNASDESLENSSENFCIPNLTTFLQKLAIKKERHNKRGSTDDSKAQEAKVAKTCREEAMNVDMEDVEIEHEPASNMFAEPPRPESPSHRSEPNTDESNLDEFDEQAAWAAFNNSIPSSRASDDLSDYEINEGFYKSLEDIEFEIAVQNAAMPEIPSPPPHVPSASPSVSSSRSSTPSPRRLRARVESYPFDLSPGRFFTGLYQTEETIVEESEPEYEAGNDEAWFDEMESESEVGDVEELESEVEDMEVEENVADEASNAESDDDLNDIDFDDTEDIEGEVSKEGNDDEHVDAEAIVMDPNQAYNDPSSWALVPYVPASQVPSQPPSPVRHLQDDPNFDELLETVLIAVRDVVRNADEALILKMATVMAENEIKSRLQMLPHHCPICNQRCQRRLIASDDGESDSSIADSDHECDDAASVATDGDLPESNEEPTGSTSDIEMDSEAEDAAQEEPLHQEDSLNTVSAEEVDGSAQEDSEEAALVDEIEEGNQPEPEAVVVTGSAKVADEKKPEDDPYPYSSDYIFPMFPARTWGTRIAGLELLDEIARRRANRLRVPPSADRKPGQVITFETTPRLLAACTKLIEQLAEAKHKRRRLSQQHEGRQEEPIQGDEEAPSEVLAEEVDQHAQVDVDDHGAKKVVDSVAEVPPSIEENVEVASPEKPVQSEQPSPASPEKEASLDDTNASEEVPRQIDESGDAQVPRNQEDASSFEDSRLEIDEELIEEEQLANSAEESIDPSESESKTVESPAKELIETDSPVNADVSEDKVVQGKKRQSTPETEIVPEKKRAIEPVPEQSAANDDAEIEMEVQESDNNGAKETEGSAEDDSTIEHVEVPPVESTITISDTSDSVSTGAATVPSPTQQPSPSRSSEVFGDGNNTTAKPELRVVRRLRELIERDQAHPRPRTPTPEPVLQVDPNDESNARRLQERRECEELDDSTQVEREGSVENVDDANIVEQEPVLDAEAEIAQAHENNIDEGDRQEGNDDIADFPDMYNVQPPSDYEFPSEEDEVISLATTEVSEVAAPSSSGSSRRRRLISSSSSESAGPSSSASSRRRRLISSSSSEDEPPTRRQRREFSLEPDAMDADNYRWCERCYRGCRCPGIPRPQGHRDDLPPPPPPPVQHDDPAPEPENPPLPPKRRRRQNEPTFGRLQHIVDIEGVDLPNAPAVVVDEEDVVYEGANLSADQQTDVLRGENFTLALYESGVVVFQGFFDGGSTASALMREAARQPITLMNHPHHRIVQVVIGPNHVVMRSEDGNVFTVGRSREGQLGVANPSRYRQSALTPEAMHRPIMDGGRRVVITDIRVEGNTTVAIADNRVEYRCGEGFGSLFSATALPVRSDDDEEEDDE